MLRQLIKTIGTKLGQSASRGGQGLVRGAFTTPYIGKYSIGGGVLRLGAYGAGAQVLGAFSENADDLTKDWSPASRWLAKTGASLGSMYLGYRGVKSFARGVAGSVQGMANAMYEPKYRRQLQRREFIVGKEPAHIKSVQAMETAGIPVQEPSGLVHTFGRTYTRVTRAGKFAGPGQQYFRPAGAGVTAKPIYKNNLISDHSYTGIIRGFEKAAKWPSQKLKNMLFGKPGQKGYGLSGHIGSAMVGMVTGPFEYGKAGLAGLGFRLGFKKGSTGLSKGLFTGGGISGAVRETMYAFGQMNHPYSGALSLGLAAGGGAHLISSMNKRRSRGTPMMKTGVSRPSNNFSPNVVFMAHNRNRGL